MGGEKRQRGPAAPAVLAPALLATFLVALAAACSGSSATSDAALSDAGGPDGAAPDAGAPDAADAPKEAGPILTCGGTAPAEPRVRDNEPPCRYDLPLPPEDNDSGVTPSNIDVLQDGVQIPRDLTHTDGWDYLDFEQTIIELFGPACGPWPDAGAPPEVQVRFICLLEGP